MDLDAGVADIAGTCAADFVGNQPIGFRLDKAKQVVPECVELVRFEAAFENRILNAHSIILTDARDFCEALVIGDIVGDDGQHLTFSAAVTAEFAWRGFIREGFFPPSLHTGRDRLLFGVA